MDPWTNFIHGKTIKPLIKLHHSLHGVLLRKTCLQLAKINLIL